MWAGLALTMFPIAILAIPDIAIYALVFLPISYLVSIVLLLVTLMGIVMFAVGLSIILKLEPSLKTSLKKYALLTIIILLFGLVVPLAFFL